MIDLKQYVCTVPFKALEIHDNSYFLCCASWLKKHFAFKSEFWKQNFEKTTLYKSFKSGFAFFLQKTFGSKSNYLQK